MVDVPPAYRPVDDRAGHGPDGNRAVFRTSRVSALVRGVPVGVAALVCSSIAQGASAGGHDGTAFVFFVGFVLLAVPAVRLLWAGVRPQRRVEVSADGLTIGTRELPWSRVARVRVVHRRGRPWLVMWPADPREPRLAGLRHADHGGYRVFPVGHERRRTAREHEVRELRAALAWYGRAAYDWSP